MLGDQPAQYPGEVAEVLVRTEDEDSVLRRGGEELVDLPADGARSGRLCVIEDLLGEEADSPPQFGRPGVDLLPGGGAEPEPEGVVGGLSRGFDVQGRPAVRRASDFAAGSDGRVVVGCVMGDSWPWGAGGRVVPRRWTSHRSGNLG